MASYLLVKAGFKAKAQPQPEPLPEKVSEPPAPRPKRRSESAAPTAADARKTRAARRGQTPTEATVPTAEGGSPPAPLPEEMPFEATAPSQPGANVTMRGKLKACAAVWRATVVNQLVLSWVLQGFPLMWSTGPPQQTFWGKNHQSALDNSEFVSNTIQDLLRAGTIQCQESRPFMTCPLGVVEQKGKFRLIWDGREVNKHLHVPEFRYESLRQVPGWLRPDDFMFTLDLKSGYHHMDIRESDWQYLGFEWQGIFYTFTQLPFGLASACWAFTKLMREVMRTWRKQGWRCSGYIDDQLHAHQEASVLKTRRTSILSLLESLGFCVNCKNSMLGEPLKRVRHLGMLVDTSLGVFIVPDVKRARLLDNVKSALSCRRMKVRSLASIKGQLLSMSWAFGPVARLYTRAIGFVIESRRSWNSHVSLSEDAKGELDFWTKCFDRFNGTRAMWEPTHVHSIVFCDAAGKSDKYLGGWGAWTFVNTRMTQARGNWGARLSAMGSTPQELQAVLNALQSFNSPAGLRHQVVCVITDSLNCANIIKSGSAKAENSYAIACEIFWYCIAEDITLQAEWRPREENVLADELSKLQDRDDWMVNRAVFKRLASAGGPFDVDLFASHTNHLVPQYYSKFCTPTTSGVDAFRYSWGLKCWANPPFCILLKVLRHAQFCKARVCLIVPHWPTRDWWSFLTKDGSTFEPFVHDLKHLGAAHDLFLPGSSGNETPRGRAAWPALALLADFTHPSPRQIKVPADPCQPRALRHDDPGAGPSRANSTWRRPHA